MSAMRLEMRNSNINNSAPPPREPESNLKITRVNMQLHTLKYHFKSKTATSVAQTGI